MSELQLLDISNILWFVLKANFHALYISKYPSSMISILVVVIFK